MAQLSFSAQVDAWCQKSRRRMEAVFKESTQRLFTIALTPVGAGGNMPIETGFLRSSFSVTLDSPNTTLVGRPKGDGTYDVDMGELSLVIASAELGQTIYGVFTANYAIHQEYGSRGQAGRGFVRLAAQQWPQIVQGTIRDAKARSGAQ